LLKSLILVREHITLFLLLRFVVVFYYGVFLFLPKLKSQIFDMNNQNHETYGDVSGGISVYDIYVKMRSAARYISKKWLPIFLSMLVGTIIGTAYSLFAPIKYLAISSFVVADNEGSALNQLAGIASIAGLSLGNQNSVFKGDNLLELYKSRKIIEKTLLSRATFNGKQLRLIDRYTEVNKLKERWEDHDHLKNITFNGDPQQFNRAEDSIITDIWMLFNKKYLDVSRPDKKLGTIKVSFTSNDELFAKTFDDQLVVTVNQYYKIIKTMDAAENEAILQKQYDSVKSVLNRSLSGVASALDASPNANPALQILHVSSQKQQVEVQANSAIYAELAKNLEVSKINLQQQTPLVQMIDEPVLPLANNHVRLVTAIVIGAIIAFFVAVSILLVNKFLRTILSH